MKTRKRGLGIWRWLKLQRLRNVRWYRDSEDTFW